MSVGCTWRLTHHIMPHQLINNNNSNCINPTPTDIRHTQDANGFMQYRIQCIIFTAIFHVNRNQILFICSETEPSGIICAGFWQAGWSSCQTSYSARALKASDMRHLKRLKSVTTLRVRLLLLLHTRQKCRWTSTAQHWRVCLCNLDSLLWPWSLIARSNQVIRGG